MGKPQKVPGKVGSLSGEWWRGVGRLPSVRGSDWDTCWWAARVDWAAWAGDGIGIVCVNDKMRNFLRNKYLQDTLIYHTFHTHTLAHTHIYSHTWVHKLKNVLGNCWQLNNFGFFSWLFSFRSEVWRQQLSCFVRRETRYHTHTHTHTVRESLTHAQLTCYPRQVCGKWNNLSGDEDQAGNADGDDVRATLLGWHRTKLPLNIRELHAVRERGGERETERET